MHTSAFLRRKPRAFTLVEMLVTIGVLTILLSLLLPALTGARRSGQTAQCINNLKQLGIAVNLYLADNGDVYPGAASRAAYGPQKEDWVYWQKGRDLSESRILRHLGNFKILQCPSDGSSFEASQAKETKDDRYPFSYSITSYQVENDTNPGIATIVTKDGSFYPFKSSRIQKPSEVFLMVEESAADDGRWIPADWDSAGTKWNPRLAPFAARHQRRAVALYVDAHASKVQPSAAQVLSNSLGAEK